MSTNSEVLVLDGGFSNELNKYCSFDVHQEPLWTAKALIGEQDAIIKTHLAYLEAGADVIETSTFQATIPGFQKYQNLSIEDGEQLIRSSVTLAKTAIESYLESVSTASELPATSSRKKPLVGGSIGPYGAYLRDGSEYSGNYMDTVTTEELTLIHLPRIRALVEGKADLLIVETVPSLVEAVTVLDLIKHHYPTAPVWVVFSLKADDALSTPRGESLLLAFETVTKYTQVAGFGINCCQPRDIQPFLEGVVPLKTQLLEKESRNVQIVVYPNSGDDWIRGRGWVKKDIPSIDSYAKQWMDTGANVIGGCCQIGPDGINSLRKIVSEWNKNRKTVSA